MFSGKKIDRRRRCSELPYRFTQFEHSIRKTPDPGSVSDCSVFMRLHYFIQTVSQFAMKRTQTYATSSDIEPGSGVSEILLHNAQFG